MIRTDGIKIKLLSLLLIIAFLTFITACSSKTSSTLTMTTTLTVTTTLTINTTPPLTTPTLVITPIPIERLFDEQKFFPTYDTEENKILSLILDNPDAYPGYAVINRYTGFDDDIINDKDYILNYFKTQGYDFSDLLNQLIERNQNHPMLTIRSSREQGYYIDYRDVFSVFFNYVPFSDSWDKMYEFYPDAHGIYTVSIPAYDPVTGYVLVYMAGGIHSLASSGWLTAFQYKDGKLTKITSHVLWIS